MENKEKKPYIWKKKGGDYHIAGINTTLCGMPMLGNNYAIQETDVADCDKCLLEKQDKELRTEL